MGKKKKQKLGEDESLAKPKLKRSASQLGLVDTNSFDGDEVLTIPRRKVVKEDVSSPELKKAKVEEENEDELTGGGLSDEVEYDHSVIGIFSREAYETSMGVNWRNQMEPNTDRLATKISKKRVDAKDQQGLFDRQNRTKESAYGDQINALFKNKMIPHVIAVIEGETEEEPITLKTKVKETELSLKYERKEYKKGLKITKRGERQIESAEPRQHLTVYVRDDMTDVYSVSTVEIPRSYKGEKRKMKAVAIDYETTDGKKYRTLVVHIKNDYASGNKQVRQSHEAFKAYARDVASKEGRVVTGYIGDTNYDKPFYERSVPSMGGYSSSGEHINPRASANNTRDTNYMQHIPLDDQADEYSVRQPSTLNYVFPETGSVTDHPSILGYTAHKKRLKGRNSKVNPSYYDFELGEFT
ncbi:MAG: hypothetical protein CBB72_010975 [Muricauda sp. TMED12]|nr:MAG: hypothetical protein CBB72_010975 [Muricauda sp. TMED12]